MDRRLFLLTSVAMATFSSLPAFAQDTETADDVIIEDMAIGSEAEDAVTLIEYSSFTCPACRAFHEQTWPELKAQYIDTGKIRFVNREILRNRADLWAALIARCGDGSKYFGLTDMYYKEQSVWPRGSEAEVADNLRKIGLLAGFDKEAVNACFSDRDFALALIEKTQSESEADGVTGTPTLFVDGERLTGADFDTVSKAIEAALAAKG